MLQAGFSDNRIVFTAAILSAIGVMALNSLPILVGTAAVEYKLDSHQVGYIASILSAGSAVMPLTVSFWIRRFNWRSTVLLTMFGGVASCAWFLFAQQLSLIQVSLFLFGLFSGGLYVVAMTCLSECRNVDTSFGLAMAFQWLLGAALVFAYPAWVTPRWGVDGIIAVYLALFVLGASLYRWFPKKGVKSSERFQANALGNLPIVALFAMLIINVGAMGIWAFLERFGNLAGFSAKSIGAALSIGLIGGGLGAATSALIGNRFGRCKPIMATSIVMVLSILLILYGDNVFAYGVCVFLFIFSWIAGVVYQESVVSVTDWTGRIAPYIAAVFFVSGAIGPLIVGSILNGSYLSTYLLVVAAVGIGVTLFMWITSKQVHIGA